MKLNNLIILTVLLTLIATLNLRKTNDDVTEIIENEDEDEPQEQESTKSDVIVLESQEQTNVGLDGFIKKINKYFATGDRSFNKSSIDLNRFFQEDTLTSQHIDAIKQNSQKRKLWFTLTKRNNKATVFIDAKIQDEIMTLTLEKKTDKSKTKKLSSSTKPLIVNVNYYQFFWLMEYNKRLQKEDQVNAYNLSNILTKWLNGIFDQYLNTKKSVKKIKKVNPIDAIYKRVTENTIKTVVNEYIK